MCVLFQDSRLAVIQFPLSWFVEQSELQNRPTKCWFLNTGSSDFDKNIPLNDVRLELGICQEIFGAFYASKCHFLLNFCPLFLHRGIEVAFAFWGGLNFRVNFKSVPFLCEKCPFLSYLGCLEEAINPIAKTGSFFARNWKLVDKLWSLPPQFKKMLCADLLQYFLIFAGKCCLLYSQIT